MPVDIRKIVLAAAEAALQDDQTDKQKSKSKSHLTTGRALLLGAGLMTAGKLLAGSRGRDMLGSLQERLDEHRDGSEDEEQDYQDEDLEAEGEEDFEDEDYEEPVEEGDGDLEDEEIDPEDDEDYEEPAAEGDEDLEDEEPAGEGDEDLEDEEPEDGEPEGTEADEEPRQKSRRRKPTRGRA
jgi:hypothetical protein